MSVYNKEDVANLIYRIAVKEDDWLREARSSQTMWIVELTNGLTVYQDDDRGGVEPASAWIRLKRYCQNANCGIKSMRLQFRTHHVDVGSDAEAFFFRKAVLGSIGLNARNPLYSHMYYYITGMVKDGVLTVTRWNVPAIIEQGVENRDIIESEESLIWDYGKKTAELSTVGETSV